MQVQSPAGTTASCVCWHEGCSDGAVHWKLITIHYNITVCLKERSAKRSGAPRGAPLWVWCTRNWSAKEQERSRRRWRAVVEMRMAYHRSRLGRRQPSVAKQPGEKSKQQRRSVGIFQETKIQSKWPKYKLVGISVDVDDQGNLIALYTQLSNEYNRREREGGRDS